MSNPVIDKYGDKRWRNSKGQFHREDGPAIETAKGSKSWWKDGKLHREDGPASISYYGKEQWYYEGEEIII